MRQFLSIFAIFQVTLPTPEPSSPNETSEPESKSTVIDTDETTKNSDDEEEDDEADKTIDDNTEDDSAVWIELYIMKEKKENYAIEDLKSSFFNSFKKALFS